MNSSVIFDKALWFHSPSCQNNLLLYRVHAPPPPKKKKKKKKKIQIQIQTEQSIQSIFRTLLWLTVNYFTLLDRASFPHYNNTKIIKFGWELYFMSNFLWNVIFGICPISRVPRHDNESFSSTCANTYQHSTSYKEISVPMTCLDCKSLSLNSIVISVRQWMYDICSGDNCSCDNCSDEGDNCSAIIAPRQKLRRYLLRRLLLRRQLLLR